jgi:hypothetical protein
MPRAGTSLLMRMLDAGGLPALTDQRRPADRHNPHGYFEDERARRLEQDASWLEEARGRAVKIVYRLLPYLPAHLAYRILFADRDLREVYDSQQEMLLARHEPAAAQDRDTMLRALSREVETATQWLAARPETPYLIVPYRELIAEPHIWSRRVADLLDGGLDEPAMAAAVDPSLYRHRS